MASGWSHSSCTQDSDRSSNRSALGPCGTRSGAPTLLYKVWSTVIFVLLVRQETGACPCRASKSGDDDGGCTFHSAAVLWAESCPGAPGHPWLPGCCHCHCYSCCPSLDTTLSHLAAPAVLCSTGGLGWAGQVGTSISTPPWDWPVGKPVVHFLHCRMI